MTLAADDLRPHDPGYGCGLCQHVFGTLTGFDAHQVRRYGTPTVITCKAPESMGLVPDQRGIWRTPEAIANIERHTANLQRGRGPFTRADPPAQLISDRPGADLTPDEAAALLSHFHGAYPEVRTLLGLDRL